MSDQPAQGRSRGRGKTRSRGPAATAVPPAGGPGPAQASAAPPAVGPTPTQPAGGRRNHRGAPRTDVARPQEGVADLSQAMGGMEISESAGRGASRRRQDEYTLDNTRPEGLADKRGISGEGVCLYGNYFEVISKQEWVVHHYRVDFAPNVDSRFIRKVLVHTQKDHLGSCYLFDGMNDLKTLQKLDDGLELFAQRKTDNEVIKISLKYVAELKPNSPQLIHLFNTQMRRNLQHLKFTLLGRYYYDQSAISQVPSYNLEIWQGVITSIRQQEEKLMMIVDTVSKVIRRETALDIIQSVMSRNSHNFQEEVAKELVGGIVMTMYNNRTYRIEDICWELKPTDTFDTRDGKQKTYTDYYKNQYGINVRDVRQPLMLCTSKEKMIRSEGQKQTQRKIYLIPELCSMTGLTDSMRNNRKMMTDLSTYTKLDPQRRVTNLGVFIDRMNKNPDVDKEMRGWGLKFSHQLVKIKGRILPPEQIVLGPVKCPYPQKTADFSRDMRGKRMHVSYELNDWIVLHTQREQGVCGELLSTLNRVCGPMGMRIRDPVKVPIRDDKIASYIQGLRQHMTKSTQLVLFIVPNNKKDRYDALKKTTCIECPIPSQVVVARTIGNPKSLMTISTKIGIQLNCKLGGEAWAVDIPLRQYNVMVIGYDTYHDSSKKGRSAGGFVASLNSSFTRWYSKVNFHQAGAWQEMSDSLKLNVTAALRKYQEVNSALPALILFYRDGVGDGSIRYVKAYENEQFKTTLRDICGDMMPRISFIVVNKSINSRFFAVGSNNACFNPTPGTVVDSVVTRADRYDFFLISQTARQGTVAPTMYNIIDDTSNLRPDNQQRLAYKLCHLYFNWQGTVRVPAPCQYAHKLAFLAGQSLHREPAEELSDKLYFL